MNATRTTISGLTQWARRRGKPIALVNERKRAIGMFLANSRSSGLDAQGRLIVEPDPADAMSREHLEDADNRRFVETILRELTGAATTYRLAETGKPAPRAARAAATAAASAATPAAPVLDDTPAEEEAEPEPARSPFEIAASNPTIQKALELFDGEITP